MKIDVELIHKVRVWSFIICFSSAILLFWGSSYFSKLPLGVLKLFIFISIPVGILTTFAVLLKKIDDHFDNQKEQGDKKRRSK